VEGDKPRDLSGGWHDAGDYNKYIGYVYPAIHQLLLAYELNPTLWKTLDLGIPESGNDVPDLLDEIRYELDWILKMQEADGSFLLLVGGEKVKGYWGKYKGLPASKNDAPRWSLPAAGPTTVAACSMLAHAALVYATLPQEKAYADRLIHSAERGWDWLERHPDRVGEAIQFDRKTRPLVASSGRLYGKPADVRLGAAAFLHLATGKKTYATLLEQATRKAGGDLAAAPTFLRYATSPRAEPAVAERIRRAYRRAWLPKAGEINAYRDPARTGYHWSSNKSVCSDAAHLLLLARCFPLTSEERGKCIETAAGRPTPSEELRRAEEGTPGL